MAVFLSALELSIVGTALPTIVHDLQGDHFVWVGGAYALTSAAFMPTAGGLSNIFGRRALMLNSIAFFTAGAAIAGSARSMNMLIAARGMLSFFTWCPTLEAEGPRRSAIQGVGGGGIIALSEVIITDLVPLRERGKYTGIIAAVCFRSMIAGPLLLTVPNRSGHWLL